MKVKELLALLAQADPELDVVVQYADDDYWGVMHCVASEAYEGSESCAESLVHGFVIK